MGVNQYFEYQIKTLSIRFVLNIRYSKYKYYRFLVKTREII